MYYIAEVKIPLNKTKYYDKSEKKTSVNILVNIVQFLKDNDSLQEQLDMTLDNLHTSLFNILPIIWWKLTLRCSGRRVVFNFNSRTKNVSKYLGSVLNISMQSYHYASEIRNQNRKVYHSTMMSIPLSHCIYPSDDSDDVFWIQIRHQKNSNGAI